MMLGNRFSQHSFARTPSVNMARSAFDRSFTAKDTFEFDYLIPFFADEVLPGDTINLNLASFARLAPQVKPIMDNMIIDYFYFFVPNRLVWNNWERFNGAQDDPGDSTDFLVPVMDTDVDNSVGSLWDHMGLPTDNDGGAEVPDDICAFPFRAYNLIWNEWFRDQNLQNSLPVHKDDGPDPGASYLLRKRARKHDYFSSGLPWPQKGTPVELPLGATAPIISTGENFNFSAVDGTWNNLPMQGIISSDPTNPNSISSIGAMTATKTVTFGTETGLVADLADATAATINQFRQAIMMQSLMELDARGGTRYTEILRSHFNVVSPDFRLQRPEFLSGGTTMIQQHIVAQTSSSTEDSPQANVSAFSTSAAQGNKVGFSKSFVEHGWVIGLLQARGEVTYQANINKKWTRRTRFDYFWPKLQELGEQAVLKKELLWQGTAADAEVLCYQERYAEYKYHPSEIRGQFRSSFPQSLDVWHLAQELDTAAFNADFIESNTPMERILVVQPDPENMTAQILMDMFFQYKHVRPMVSHPTPASLGRF